MTWQGHTICTACHCLASGLFIFLAKGSAGWGLQMSALLLQEYAENRSITSVVPVDNPLTTDEPELLQMSPEQAEDTQLYVPCWHPQRTCSSVAFTAMACTLCFLVQKQVLYSLHSAHSQVKHYLILLSSGLSSGGLYTGVLCQHRLGRCQEYSLCSK